MVKAAAFILACILLSGCAQSSKEAKKVIEKDNGKFVELKIGNTLIAELPGNPTTGYTWEVAECDPSVLKFAGEPGYKTNTNYIGSPGKITLKFKAAAAGRTGLKLVYRRPWEKDIAPVKTYRITVDVK